MRQIRKIVLDGPLAGGFMEFQSLYMDHSNGELIPDTEVWDGCHPAIKINSLGCKGEELEPNKPVIAVFGDSGVFGISLDSWVKRISLEGYQLLNAGVEGYSLERILLKYQHLKQRVKFDTVIIYGGWHNLLYNTNTEPGWRTLLEGFISPDHKTIFSTLFCSLHPDCRERGLADVLCAPQDIERLNKLGDYSFWGDKEPSMENIRAVMAKIDQYHFFMRAFCAEKGLALIDNYEFMMPNAYNEIPREFFDICHPRLPIYPKIAKFVEKRLHDILVPEKSDIKQSWINRMIGKSKESPTSTKVDTTNTKVRDETQNIYPLW